MIGRVFTSDHHVYDLPALLEWNVTHTGTVPCDSYSVTFLYQKDMAEVLHLAAGFAAIQDGVTMLRGIVDEYVVELGQKGLLATVSGRGYAARLLDNESRPVTYQDATLEEIIRCHVTPYGIPSERLLEFVQESHILWPLGLVSGKHWKISAKHTVDFHRVLRGTESCWRCRKGRMSGD